jgi:hypothetical protein
MTSLRAPTVYPHLFELPQRGNMLVEKKCPPQFFCAVGATLFRHRCPKCISECCTYGAKDYVDYYFYQHLAPTGAIFLNRYTCGYTVAPRTGW